MLNVPNTLRSASTLIAIGLFLSACLDGGQSPLMKGNADNGNGPKVVFDPLADPNPEVPLPNDIVTVIDTGSPTAIKVNIRHSAATQFERDNRTEINRLNGFGTFAPIMVSFETPLDLSTVTTNNIYLINIDPSSDNYGEEIPLDLPENLTRSSYPLEITPWPFPPHSPYIYSKQIMFNPDYQGEVTSPEYADLYERETNTLLLRVLRPMDQETTYMVVLTKNVLGENGEPVRSPFAVPAHIQQTRQYQRAADILSRKGIPEKRIAFAWSFTTQTITKDLEVIASGLHGEGVMAYLQDLYPPAFSEIANMETDMDSAFCALLNFRPCRDNKWILQTEMLAPFMSITQAPGLVRSAGILLLDADLGKTSTMTVSLDALDYFVFGNITSPNFQETKTGKFRMDYRSGKAWTNEIEVPFMIAVPKETAEFQPPFPVVLLVHGVPALRWQIITEANSWAKKGFATAVLSAPMHSPITTVHDIQFIVEKLITGGESEGFIADLMTGAMSMVNCIFYGRCDDEPATFEEALDIFLSTGLMAQLLVEGRAEDVDGDGITDHGAIFTADLFKSRDRIRQHVVEQMQFHELFKSLSQDNVPPAVDNPSQASADEIMPNLLAGDFNADGILDLGGLYAYGSYKKGKKPSQVAGHQRYFRSGLSFGGITNSILMAVEPDIKTVAMSVPGGGLTDIVLRSDLHAAVDRVHHELMGPVIVGEPVLDDLEKGEAPTRLRISFIQRGRKTQLTGAEDESLWTTSLPVDIQQINYETGGRLRIVNLSNGEYHDLFPETCLMGSIMGSTEDIIGEPGCFSFGVPADKGDVVQVTSFNLNSKPIDELLTHAPQKGMGKPRNSPDFRYFTSLGQVALDPADPINYAPHWFLDPLRGPGTEKNIMVVNVPGDMFVPINTQVAVVRAGGLLGSESNACDGLPKNPEECGSTWAEISSDCDCINYYWEEKGLMIGYDEGTEGQQRKPVDVDKLSGSPTQCRQQTTPVIDNTDKGAGYSFVRFPHAYVECAHGYIKPVYRGMHWLMAGFNNPEMDVYPDEVTPIDWSVYYQAQMAEYMATEGYEKYEEYMTAAGYEKMGVDTPDLDCPCPIEADTCRFLP